MEKILSQKFIKRKQKLPPISLIRYPITIADAFGASSLPFNGNLTISGYGEMLALFNQYFLDYRGEFRFQFLDNEVIDMSSQQLFIGSLNIQYSTSSWLNYNTEYKTDAYPIPVITNMVLPVGNNGSGANFNRNPEGTFFQYIPPDSPPFIGPPGASRFKVDFSALVYMLAQGSSPLVRFQLAINYNPLDDGGSSSVSSYLSNGGSITYSFSTILELSPLDRLSILVTNVAQSGNPDPQVMYIQSQSIVVTQLF